MLFCNRLGLTARHLPVQQQQAAMAVLRLNVLMPSQQMMRTWSTVQPSGRTFWHRRARQAPPLLLQKAGMAFHQDNQPWTSLRKCRLLHSITLAALWQPPLLQKAQQQQVLQHSILAGWHRMILGKTCQHSRTAELHRGKAWQRSKQAARLRETSCQIF